MSQYSNTSRQQDLYYAYLFIIPLVLVIIGLVAYPFVKAFILSMSQKFSGSATAEFVGLKHYISLANNIIFQKALRNTFLWAFAAVIFKLVFGMLMALTLNQKFKGNNLVRGLLLVPWIIPTAISSLVWLWIFNDMGGVLNYILGSLGLIKYPIAWLGSGALAMGSVIVVNLWRGTPFFGITLLAGLKNIPEELNEAAKIDGANRVQNFFYVTLPNLKHVILITSLLESIWALGDFAIVYIMTKGGPAGATHLLSTLTYEVGFLSGDLGRGVAVSLFPFPILALLIVAVTYFMEVGKE